MSSFRSRLVPLLAMLVVVISPVSPAAANQSVRTAAAEVTPIPIEFPRDDGPHDMPLEWWYVTGHLFTDTGDRYGFQMVVFKGQRDELLGYAAHVAIVDPARETFRYDERLIIGDSVSTDVPGGGFDLQLKDWHMSGANGNDRLAARLDGYAFDLETRSTKPAALHDGDGFIDYGSDQYSYYYSRTRLETAGTLEIDGQVVPVHGEAWMDHQWGDFTTWDSGGWDWFALQFDDGTELMLYVIAAPAGSPGIVDGSLVAPDGSVTLLGEEDFTVTPTRYWSSPSTGARYPSGWSVDLPTESLVLSVTPVLPGQELDTTRSTGQIYWEGEVTIDGRRGGKPVGGLGYVELTGYADTIATPEASAPVPGTPRFTGDSGASSAG
jgi:predicted secreted hydrolase